MTEAQGDLLLAAIAEIKPFIIGGAKLLGELRGLALLMAGFWFASQLFRLAGFTVSARNIATNGVP